MIGVAEKRKIGKESKVKVFIRIQLMERKLMDGLIPIFSPENL